MFGRLLKLGPFLDNLQFGLQRTLVLPLNVGLCPCLGFLRDGFLEALVLLKWHSGDSRYATKIYLFYHATLLVAQMNAAFHPDLLGRNLG